MCVYGAGVWGGHDYAHHRELPASGKQRAGMPLNSDDANHHSQATKNDPAPNVNRTEVERPLHSLMLARP